MRAEDKMQSLPGFFIFQSIPDKEILFYKVWIICRVNDGLKINKRLKNCNSRGNKRILSQLKMIILRKKQRNAQTRRCKISEINVNVMIVEK